MVKLELLEGVSAAKPEAWNALVGDESPFLEWEWLASLEEAGAVGEDAGWWPRPLVAFEDGRLVAACPLYGKTHSEGEFVFDFAWADAAERAGLAYYPKLLAAVPFTPVTGARVLTAPGEERGPWIARFGTALRDLCEESGLSGVHVNFCRTDEVQGLERIGFVPRAGFQYHWSNAGFADFDDYLGNLRSKRRHQIRHERRALAEAGIRVEARVGRDIPEAWFAAMYDFYRDTVEKYPWGRLYLSRRFFELLRDRFAHRLCLVMARDGDTLLGGVLNVQKGDALYGRYWGARAEIRYLHFEVCYYAGIEHCIRNGLARFEPGAGGEYKHARGFDARPTWSCHYLADPRLATAVARHLELERAEVARVIELLEERSARRGASS